MECRAYNHMVMIYQKKQGGIWNCLDSLTDTMMLKLQCEDRDAQIWRFHCWTSPVHVLYKWNYLYCVWLYADDTVLYFDADSVILAINKFWICMTIKQMLFFSEPKICTTLTCIPGHFPKKKRTSFSQAITPLWHLGFDQYLEQSWPSI